MLLYLLLLLLMRLPLLQRACLRGIWRARLRCRWHCLACGALWCLLRAMA